MTLEVVLVLCMVAMALTENNVEPRLLRWCLLVVQGAVAVVALWILL